LPELRGLVPAYLASKGFRFRSCQVMLSGSEWLLADYRNCGVIIEAVFWPRAEADDEKGFWHPFPFHLDFQHSPFSIIGLLPFSCRRGVFMRFTKDGPSITDELLNARDEGRVVFVCGSGVSRARAGLPDFFGLAEKVFQTLGVTEDSDALNVFNEAKKIGAKLGVTGLISMDRVFGLLAREFTVEDIQAAVARALAPNEKPDLSAHKLLLRLATTCKSKTLLVTTNFDRLFEQCNGELAIYQPPRLPNLSRYDDLDGIVYLHGRVNDDDTGANGDGFVLSSSDFGYAYLSEGWATEFFREIVREYVIVFVGYSAEDPPIHYLLEGLRRTQDSSHRIYAFQSDESDETIAQWRHKGVEAIPYSCSDGHSALWDTLELWARRADDPDAWRRSVLDLAMNGPAELQPYQRGQVAHIVSTYQGAREFSDRKPPAEWLCVFDPSCRYAKPERSERMNLESPVVDPFTLYGLDSDTTPESADPDNQFAHQGISKDAWDAFTANKMDRQDLSAESFATFRGHYAAHIPRLPKRLACLGTWIMNIADQPAAVWWTARQDALHPSVRKDIEWGIERLGDSISPVILQAWQYLLETRKRTSSESARDWYDLKREIDREGWNPAVIRQFTIITHPYLTAGPALMATTVPPKKGAEHRLWDLVRLEVECPVPPQDALIPDEWLEKVIREIRKNLELAVQLCEEVNDMHRRHISPIAPDDAPGIDNYEPTHGLSGCVLQFASLFKRLIKLDASKARKEFSAWPADDDTAFSRLRLWAGGMSEIATPDDFGEIVEGLSDDAFWSHDHQRDIMLVLARRWGKLTEKSRRQIEDRLLKGPAQWEGEDDADYKEHRAWETMARIQWLADNGCEFFFSVEEEIASRHPLAPKWKPEYAKHVSESREMRSGFVAMNTEHAALLRVPIESVLSTARKLSGRVEDNSLEEYDPFAGLCAERPRRAYLALARAARRGEYPEWAWKTFLNSSAREKDQPKFTAVIAERVCRFPDEKSGKLIYPSTWWLQGVAKTLSEHNPTTFDRVIEKLTNVMHLEPSKAGSAIISSSHGRDWVTDGLNSPAGHIARAILDDYRVEAIDDKVDISATWQTQLEKLLSLSGDPRRHAIAMISHHLDWLHYHTPEWTEQHMLSILDADDLDDKEALWAGFFWNPRINSEKLYLRLKPALLALAKQRDTSREGHVQALAYLILSGWMKLDKKKEEGWVSSDELRDVLLHGGDDFRSHIVWQFERAFRGKVKTDPGELLGRAVELFQDVWPRQRVVKSPVMSLRLVELLISSPECFPKLAEVVLPLLTKIEQGHRLYFRDEVNEIIDKHSALFLNMLHAILPDEVSDWPYGIGDVLERIGKADNNLLSDTQLLEIKRKWDAR